MVVIRPITIGPEFDDLPDDTEETLLGSSNHQGAIVGAYDGLQICAQRRGLPWFVGNQLTLLIHQEGREQSRRIAPDLMVYPTLAIAEPITIAVALHGPPTLAIEIASPSTGMDNDVNLLRSDAKPQLYAGIGVEEYLVFDPTLEMLDAPIWAQHRGPDGFTPWLADADGRWHSTLGVSFAPQGALLRVYDHEGHLVPLSTEFDAMLTAQDQRLAELEVELRRLRGE